MQTTLSLLLLLVSFASGVLRTPNNTAGNPCDTWWGCVDFVASVSGVRPDTNPVVSTGAPESNAATGFSAFATRKFLYLLKYPAPGSGLALQKQNLFAPFVSSDGIALGVISRKIMAVLIPDLKGQKPVVMFLEPVMGGMYGSRILNPVPLPSLSAGIRFTAGAVAPTAINSRAAFLINVDTVVAVCIAIPDSTATVFHLNITNPTGATIATKAQFETFGNQDVLIFSRAASRSSLPGDMVTLHFNETTCSLSFAQRVFINPQPVGLTLLPQAVYWQVNNIGNQPARLYKWDVFQNTMVNTTLVVKPGNSWTKMGLAIPLDNVGVLVDNKGPLYNQYTMRLIDLASSPPREYFRAEFSGYAPQLWSKVTLKDRIVIFARKDLSNVIQFDAVIVNGPATVQKGQPAEKTPVPRLLGSCLGSPFGYPATCLGCAAPKSICGQTESCSSGCCFVTKLSQVVCCQNSPPDIKPPFQC